MQEQLKNVQYVQASVGAFAAIIADGSVVTWGPAEYGGDSSTVQEQLKNVHQIQASLCAFAAIRGDGHIVTWGLFGMVVTVVPFLRGRTCSRSKPLSVLLLQFWRTVPSSLGVFVPIVVTVALCRIFSRLKVLQSFTLFRVYPIAFLCFGSEHCSSPQIQACTLHEGQGLSRVLGAG